MIWLWLLALMCGYLAYRSIKEYENTKDNFYIIMGLLYCGIGLLNSFYVLFTLLGRR